MGVIGCAGFLRSYLTDKLLADGHELFGIGFLQDYHRLEVKAANLVGPRGDAAATPLGANIMLLAVEAMT